MTNIIDSDQFDKEWAEEMKQYEITTQKINQEMFYHLKKFYNGEGKLYIDQFLNGAKEIVNRLFHQSWEKTTYGNINNFNEFLKKGLKLYILKFSLDYKTSKKLRKSIGRFCYMYGEIVEFGEDMTDGVKIYLEKNRHNEQKKEEIKELVERDYELFFGDGAKGKTLNTKVGQSTNEIIELFSSGYYGSLDEDTK